LEHSFLAGASLWASEFRKVAACTNDRAGSGKVSVACQKFLDGNERAQMQWKLEEGFAVFEKQF
jgi:adenosine deaminase